MSENVEASNVRFWLSETQGLIKIMDEYQGKFIPKYVSGQLPIPLKGMGL